MKRIKRKKTRKTNTERIRKIERGRKEREWKVTERGIVEENEKKIGKMEERMRGNIKKKEKKGVRMLPWP